MARTVMNRVFNSIVLIGLAVFLAVGVTMVLPDTSGHHLARPPVTSAIHPALQAAGILPPR